MTTNILNKNIHKAYIWLHDIDDKLHLDSLDSSLATLRVVLHEIRDHIPVNDSAHLSAQLPTFIRGLYYENWKPSIVPVKDRSAEHFVNDVANALSMHPEIEAKEAIEAVFETLSGYIDLNEIDKIILLLPKHIRSLID
jgi:uncharacterized protein (DUF2267 family)